MKSTFNICFYAKKDKQKANGAYPLFARITVDGVASRFNTKLDVLPSIWDGKMGKATGRTSEASRINRMLDDINASLNTIYHEMQRRDWKKSRGLPPSASPKLPPLSQLN
ncbi:Arm DNA-binding domain-containing protein [Bacteroides sp. KH365_2]|uniref:Arm DNA-binding domain-containing protein n=1 Tax=Bacteroides muris (ex Fokt et al. 2023) TaxID=2937417 RepID=A0A9X2NWI0_9BACE|nr:Arm DNA-binding domain-containing protein [Bacteroides muris (ex Fokt et al. 2023)]